MPSRPNIRQRRLALALRELRESGGIQIDAAAAQLGWSPRKIARWEAAEMSKPVLKEIEELLDVLGTTDEQREEFRNLVHEARRTQWWDQPEYADVLTPTLEQHMDLEAAAAEFRSWEGQHIPGLLQTPAYARALIEAGIPALGAAEQEQWVALRMERQRHLVDGPAHLSLLWVIIHDAALHTMVGGSEVMRRQLAHLMAMTELEYVQIQVMPFSAGAVAASEPFTIFSFRNALDPEAVSVELVGPGRLWFDDHESVTFYRDLFVGTMMKALSIKASKAHLAELIRQLG